MDKVTGRTPSGDAARVCTKYNPNGGCKHWSEKLLVVYVSYDADDSQSRKELRGMFVSPVEGQILSDFLIMSGYRIERPQVAWHPRARKWLVVYSDYDRVVGNKSVGYMHTVTVDWNQTVTAPLDIDYCEPAGDGLCSPRTAGGSGPTAAPVEYAVGGWPGPDANEGCQCKGTWVAASSKATDPPQFLLHQNYYHAYLLGADGGLLARGEAHGLQAPVSATDVPGYQFVQIYWTDGEQKLVDELLLPPDGTPPYDPWAGATDVGPITSLSGLGGWAPQTLRKGSTTALAVFYRDTDHYLYMSILNNR
ncbi:MAG: hypothetical protein HY906_02980 [Deltaproteobacteria bacterium]|nr:hypothetical protein [Deltaproteobacteria bacterium]